MLEQCQARRRDGLLLPGLLLFDLDSVDVSQNARAFLGSQLTLAQCT